jgi:hypothetical protein
MEWSCSPVRPLPRFAATLACLRPVLLWDSGALSKTAEPVSSRIEALPSSATVLPWSFKVPLKTAAVRSDSARSSRKRQPSRIARDDRRIIVGGGVSFIVGALAFVSVFSYLAEKFNYPDILDGSAADALPTCGIV